MALIYRKGSTSSVRQSAQPVRGQWQVCRSRVLHGDHGHGNHAVSWFDKHKELWLELKTKDDVQAALNSLPVGKFLIVDYYASWCAVCKTAYPGLCRIADNKEHQQHFVFAKGSLDSQEIKDFVKKEGILGIPHLSIYTSQGTKVLGMGASFKKLEAIAHNLKAIAADKEEVMQQTVPLSLDPNGFVLVPGAPVPAA